MHKSSFRLYILRTLSNIFVFKSNNFGVNSKFFKGYSKFLGFNSNIFQNFNHSVAMAFHIQRSELYSAERKNTFPFDGVLSSAVASTSANDNVFCQKSGDKVI